MWQGTNYCLEKTKCRTICDNNSFKTYLKVRRTCHAWQKRIEIEIDAKLIGIRIVYRSGHQIVHCDTIVQVPKRVSWEYWCPENQNSKLCNGCWDMSKTAHWSGKSLHYHVCNSISRLHSSFNFFSGLSLLESFCKRVLTISANRNTKPNDCGANEYASVKYFVKDHAEHQDMMWQPFKHPTHYLLRLLYNMNLLLLNAILIVINYVE